MKSFLITLFIGIALARGQVMTPSNTVFVAAGDSLTAAPPTWFWYLTNSAYLNFRPFVTYTNTAESGTGITSMDNVWTNRVRIFSSNSYDRGLSVWIGANNNIQDTGADAFIAGLSNYVFRATNEGWRVLLFTISIHNGNAGYSNALWRAAWTNVNQWILGTPMKTWTLDVASMFGPSTFGDTNVWHESTPSELHFTGWAQQVIATNVYLSLTTNVSPTSSSNFTRISASGVTATGRFIFR